MQNISDSNVFHQDNVYSVNFTNAAAVKWAVVVIEFWKSFRKLKIRWKIENPLESWKSFGKLKIRWKLENLSLIWESFENVIILWKFENSSKLGEFLEILKILVSLKIPSNFENPLQEEFFCKKNVVYVDKWEKSDRWLLNCNELLTLKNRIILRDAVCLWAVFHNLIDLHYWIYKRIIYLLFSK